MDFRLEEVEGHTRAISLLYNRLDQAMPFNEKGLFNLPKDVSRFMAFYHEFMAATAPGGKTYILIAKNA